MLAEKTSSANNTLDFEPNSNTQNRIMLPGMDGINLKSESLEQSVNFFNPPDNKCYFVIQLFLSDNTLLWQSDYILPGESINTITLNKKLNKGKYRNCKLIYNCFAIESKKQLNKGEVIIEITAN